MGEIIKAGGSLPAGLGLGSRRDARDIVRKVQLDGLRLQGDAALSGLAMELLSGLNQERKAIAMNDPELDSLLCQFLTGFAMNAQQKIRTRNSPFGSL